jgi:cyclophilin family peptidyl-prolyl cis-trans isomerase
MCEIITHKNQNTKSLIKKDTYFIHIHLIILLFSCFSAACSIPKGTPVAYSDEFIAVHEAVTQRDGLRLLTLTQSSDSLARAAAWRALASTPSAPTDSVLRLALTDGSELAWFSLSTRQLEADQLRVLEAVAFDRKFPTGLIRTLGLQGDAQTLQLMDTWSGSIEPGHPMEPEFALAMSFLQIRRVQPEPMLIRLIQRACLSSNPIAARNWLYATYRSAAMVLEPIAAEELVSNLGSCIAAKDPVARRYLARTLAKSARREALDLYPAPEIPTLDVGSAVDIVRMLPYFKEALPQEHIQALLQHPNPVVVTALLELLADDAYIPYPGLKDQIEQVLESTKKSDPRLYIKANWTLLTMPAADYIIDQESLRNVALANPYWTAEALMVLTHGKKASEVLNELKPYMKSSEHLHRMAAASVLNAQARRSLLDSEMVNDIPGIRDAIWEMLSSPNRSIAYTLFPSLRLPAFRTPDDNTRTLALLKDYRLPEDVEVYQAIIPSLLQDLGVSAVPLADSLASYGVAALNRMIRDAVSDSVRVRIDQSSSPTLLQGPDWSILRKLGTKPTFQLETELGLIVIELDPIRAPATVTALFRLAEAGLYNNVAFHRVVPNFVIQGGDIETGDGLGGPDFVIPNESSELTFERGIAGIASAGKDTEGSQYFFMIDWAPHLDGNYTVFGKLIEGQDVVNRIRVGDKVLRARVTNL